MYSFSQSIINLLLQQFTLNTISCYCSRKANTSLNIKVGTPNQSFKGNRKMEAEGLRTLVKFFTVSFCSMDAYHALDNFSFT